MDAAVKYSLIEKLVHTEDEDLLNQVKDLLESYYAYPDEHKKIVQDSLVEYKSDPKNTFSWEEVKNDIADKLKNRGV